jgi:iron(III) transport system permease protein
MISRRGRLPALALGGLLLLFILIPLGAVLRESLIVRRPMTPSEIRARVLDALDRLEPARRAEQLRRWAEQLDDRQAMQAAAATLQAIGQSVGWDRRGPFDEQIAAAAAAVAALGPVERQAFDAEFPLQAVIAHRRIPLAFAVRDRIGPEAFEALRSGQRATLGLAHYMSLWQDGRFLRAARNSLGLSIVSSLITVVLAYALAFGIARGALRFPGVIRAAVLVPLVSPPVIIAFAAVLLFGRRGLVTAGLLGGWLGLLDPERVNLYGMPGIILAQVLSYLPHAVIVLENVLAQQDVHLEEAAAAQGGTAWQVFRHVTLPLTWPGIVRAALVVFIQCMTDFGNPLIIGRNVPVLAGVIYDEILGFQNKPLAAALAVALVTPTLAAYLLFEAVGRRRRFAARGERSGVSDLEVPRVARLALEVVGGAVVLLVTVLYSTVVIGSFVRVWGIDYTLTLDHYLRVDPGLAQSHGLPAVVTSLKVAGIAAPLGGLLAIAIAYLVERVRPAGGGIIGFVALLPAILPGVILGIGYLVFFNTPFGLPGLALTGTATILVLNILFANLYVGVLAGRAALQRLDPTIDEAAEALGATLAQRFRLVTFPMLWRVFMLAALYVFVHGLTTLSAVIFLVGPEHKLASVGIFLAAEAAHYGLACATSAIVLVLVLAAMGLAWRLDRRGLGGQWQAGRT